MTLGIKNKYLKDMSFTKTKDKDKTISSLCYIVIIIVFALVLLIWLFGRTFIERDIVINRKRNSI